MGKTNWKDKGLFGSGFEKPIEVSLKGINIVPLKLDEKFAFAKSSNRPLQLIFWPFLFVEGYFKLKEAKNQKMVFLKKQEIRRIEVYDSLIYQLTGSYFVKISLDKDYFSSPLYDPPGFQKALREIGLSNKLKSFPKLTGIY